MLLLVLQVPYIQHPATYTGKYISSSCNKVHTHRTWNVCSHHPNSPPYKTHTATVGSESEQWSCLPVLAVSTACHHHAQKHTNNRTEQERIGIMPTAMQPPLYPSRQQAVLSAVWHRCVAVSGHGCQSGDTQRLGNNSHINDREHGCQSSITLYAHNTGFFPVRRM